MFDLMIKYLYQPTRQSKLYTDENCIKTVVKLAERCRKYFPATTKSELIAEIGKWLYPLQSRYLSQFVSILVIFLPNTQWDEEIVQLLEPTNGLLWSTTSKRIETLNMLLLARRTKGNLSETDWSAAAPFIFNILRRHLKLPGADAGPKSIAKWNPDEKPGNRIVRNLHPDFTRCFSRWFIRALRDGDCLLDELSLFITSMDSFCHPSNGGSWSSELTDLFLNLVESMNKRLYRKNLGYTLPPLTQATVDRFVKIIWPSMSKLVFSKNYICSLGAQAVAKGLANLSPTFVLNETLLMSEPTLSTLTEPHRTNACIGLLSSVSRKFLDPIAVPGGLATLISLFNAILPGIDPNDPFKTINSLSFTSGALAVTPIWDVSSSLLYSEDCPENANAEATAGFESFCILFIEQCLNYLRSLTKPSEGGEDGCTAILINTLDLFFMQLSPAYSDIVLDKILIFAREEVDLSSAKATGYILGKAIMHSHRYGLVLSWLLEQSKSLIERGYGHEEHESDDVCSRLICSLNMLYRCFTYACAPQSPFDYAETFVQLFDVGRQCKQKTVAILLAKTAKAFVKALSGFYPRDWRSYQSSQVNLTDFGRLYRVEDIAIDWRCPTEADFTSSLFLCDRFLGIADKIEFHRTRLIFYRNILKGILSLRSNMMVFGQGLPEVETLFSRCIDSCLDLVASLQTVETKTLMIEILGIALTYRGIGRDSYDDMHRTFGYLKSAFSYYKKDPLRPRFWYVKRAFLQHLCRLEKLGYREAEMTPRYGDIVRTLFEFSVSRFPEIHSESQSQLGRSAFMSAARTRQIISEWALRLADPSLDEDGLKALLGLRGSSMMTAICSDWQLLLNFLTWIVPLNNRPDIDSIPKIYELITGFFVDSARSFNSPPGLWNGNPRLESVLGFSFEVARYHDWRASIRTQVFDFLAQSYSTANWRTQIMISTFLLIFLDPASDGISESLVHIFVEGCASEVVDVRFTSHQACKVTLHAFNLQTNPSRPEDWCIESLLNWKNGSRTAGRSSPLEGYNFKSSFVPTSAVQKIMKVSLIEESDEPTKLNFRPDTCRLVQGLVDIMGPELFFAELEKTISKVGESEWPAGLQRISAEWIGGILKSLLYTCDTTSFSSILISRIVPLIVQSWARCGVDASRYWFGALYFACRGRAPSAIHPLYEFMKQQLLASYSCSSTEITLRIISMHALLKGCGYGTDATELLLPIMSHLFTSHFLVVRREAAHLFREIIRNLYAPGSTITSDSILLPILQRNVAMEFIKATVELGHASFNDPVLSGSWPVLPTLLPRILLAHHSDEIEMQLVTKHAAKRLAWLDYCPSKEMALSIVENLCNLISQSSVVVHVRKLAIEVLGLFYGRNYALFDEAMSGHYLSAVLAWTDDEQLEVREGATSILTMFLHTRTASASNLARSVILSLRKTVPAIKSAEGIPARHGRVLRASALILAFPYQLHEWAPQLLLILTKFLPDRAVIQATVRKTFSEFKRTHMDNWASERLLFNEEELDAISELLVSPSYYA